MPVETTLSNTYKTAVKYCFKKINNFLRNILKKTTTKKPNCLEMLYSVYVNVSKRRVCVCGPTKMALRFTDEHPPKHEGPDTLVTRTPFIVFTAACAAEGFGFILVQLVHKRRKLNICHTAVVI